MSQIKFSPSSPVILADTEIQHRKNRILARLVFDTGATYTMISWAIAQKLGLQPQAASETIPFNTASGHLEAPLVKVDKLNLLRAQVENLRAIVHDLPEDARVDGLLGLNFIKNFLVAINFNKGIITLK